MPTTGTQRGTRATSGLSTATCFETWCGQAEIGSYGLAFSDLGLYVPPEFGAVDVGWTSLPKVVSNVERADEEADGSFAWALERVTLVARAFPQVDRFVVVALPQCPLQIAAVARRKPP